MAHSFAALIVGLAASLGACVRVAAQDVAPQNAPPAIANELQQVETVVPPLPPNAAALALQCKVPQSEVAKPAPLINVAAKIEANRKVRVLAIGSSATWTATRGVRNYPSRLEKLLENVWKGVDIEVVNRGVSGEIAAVSARRLINEAAILRPSLVLWQLGTNDAIARVPMAEFESTVLATVRMLRKNHIDVVLVGLQYTPKEQRDEHWYAVRTALDKIAAEENLLYVRRDQAMEFLAQTKALVAAPSDDDFHFNDLGFPCMAEHVAQAMVANIFLRRRPPTPGPATR